MLAGLRAAVDAPVESLEVRTDSRLLVAHMHGDAPVRGEQIALVADQIRALTPQFTLVRYRWVPEAQNGAAHTLNAPVWMRDSAFLLWIRLGRQHHVRLFTQRIGQERRVGDDRSSGWVGSESGRIHAEQVEAAKLTPLERLDDPQRIKPILVDLAEARSGVGEHARLARRNLDAALGDQELWKTVRGAKLIER